MRRLFSTRVIAVAAIGLCVGALAYSAWRGLVRPWHVARELTASTKEELLFDRLGKPDLVFRTNADLRSSRLVPGSYVFTPFPGPNGESPPSIRWALYSMKLAPLLPAQLPPIEERAYWYELPLTAGVLVYVQDGKIITMYHGGT